MAMAEALDEGHPDGARGPAAAAAPGSGPGLSWAVGAALALAVFLFLGVDVGRGAADPLDTSLLRWVHAHTTPGLDGLAIAVTGLGSWVSTVTLGLVALAFLLLLGRRADGVMLVATVAGAFALSDVIKAAFHRPRPHVFPWLVARVGNSSFPSGHALRTAALLAALAWLLARMEPSRWARGLTGALAALAVALVAASRVWVGVHNPSDVVAGAAVGYLWAATCAAALGAHERRRARRPRTPAATRLPE